MAAKKGNPYKDEEEVGDVINFDQKVSDDEILDYAKVNKRKIDSYTIDKLIDITLNFGEQLSGLKHYPYQRKFNERILYSLIKADMETIVVEFARQSGKSTGTSILVPAVTIMMPILAKILKDSNIKTDISRFEKGFLCGIYGPDYERADIIGRKVNNVFKSDLAKQILSAPDIGMDFPKNVQYFLSNYLPNNSLIRVKSAKKGVSIEGDSWHLVITDETQEINDVVIGKSLSPMTSAIAGTTVHLGSAYTRKVYFYDMIKLNKARDLTLPTKLKTYFGVNYVEASRYNKYYKKYIEKEKAKYGEHSDFFQMNYNLKWSIEEGMFLTEPELMMCAKDYYPSPGDRTNDHIISIDLAKIRDSTVITVIEPDYENPIVIDAESRIVRHQKKIKTWYEIHGTDYDAQFYMICDYISNFKWSVMIVDATGVGSPMYDRLKNRFSNKNVIPFTFSLQSKSEIYLLLDKEIRSQRISFPNSEGARKMSKQKNFIAQMTNLQKQMRGAYLSVSHISEKGNDDYPDSLALGVWAAETNLNLEVKEDYIEIYKEDNFATNFWRT